MITIYETFVHLPHFLSIQQSLTRHNPKIFQKLKFPVRKQTLFNTFCHRIHFYRQRYRDKNSFILLLDYLKITIYLLKIQPFDKSQKSRTEILHISLFVHPIYLLKNQFIQTSEIFFTKNTFIFTDRNLFPDHLISFIFSIQDTCIIQSEQIDFTAHFTGIPVYPPGQLFITVDQGYIFKS